jgi:hypothetical protein
LTLSISSISAFGVLIPLEVKTGSPALTMVRRRRYYGIREELFEVTVTTHPEGRYIYDGHAAFASVAHLKALRAARPLARLTTCRWSSR